MTSMRATTSVKGICTKLWTLLRNSLSWKTATSRMNFQRACGSMFEASCGGVSVIGGCSIFDALCVAEEFHQRRSRCESLRHFIEKLRGSGRLHARLVHGEEALPLYIVDQRMLRIKPARCARQRLALD